MREFGASVLTGAVLIVNRGCVDRGGINGREPEDGAGTCPPLRGRGLFLRQHRVEPPGHERADHLVPLPGAGLHPADCGRPFHPAAGGLAARHDDGDPAGAGQPRQRLLAGACYHIGGVRPPDVPGGAGTVLTLDNDPDQARPLGSLRDEVRRGLTH